MKLNENLPERFTRAIEKLYTAFHEGTLNAMNCKQCAVGNICNNKSDWRYIVEYGADMFALSHDKDPKGVINEAGYSIVELMKIEKLFMYGVKAIGQRHKHCHRDEDGQFKGLCAVVEYLCELDGIPNVMDFSKLFETEDNVPKYELIK